jgi:hypothetical protein
VKTKARMSQILEASIPLLGKYSKTALGVLDFADGQIREDAIPLPGKYLIIPFLSRANT